MPSRLANPYRGCFAPVQAPEGGAPAGRRWVRGNLHGHCQEHSGCSSVPLRRSIARYRDAGALFLAVTDHDHVTDLSQERRQCPDLALLEGFEYSSDRNVLFIGERVPPLYRLPLGDALREAHARAGSQALFTIVCHPRPRTSEEYWTPDRILSLDPVPACLEVFNGHYLSAHPLWKDTNPLASDIWDECLTRGARLWASANDDFHDPSDFGRAWNMACVESLSPSGVIAAIAAGRFYGTTGPRVHAIEVQEGKIEVTIDSDASGRFIGPEGRVLSETRGRRFAWRHGGEAYVRFEAAGEAGLLWLQPFFREAS